jgi:ribosomal protein L37AE/L43A
MEQHPYRHDWYRSVDAITERNSRGRVIGVVREERCRHCPTLRFTRIDTNVWERRGKPRYKYEKGKKIIRVTARDYLRRLFLDTTDLPQELFGAR